MDENKETALAAPASMADLAALATGNKHDLNELDTLARSVEFLSRMQLFGGNTNAAKEGKVGMGNYGYVDGDTIIDLGKDVDVAVIAWRPMAMDMTDKVPVKVFDKDSAVFKEIQENSFKKDSGCAYGVDCLVYIPKIKKFATLFFGSKSNRREVKNFLTNLGKGASLSSEFVKEGKYSWHVIKSSPCTAPLEIPSMEEILKKKKMFDDEASSAKVPEKADATPARDR